MQGKIIKGIAGFYYVHVVEFGVYECKAKGVFRKEKIKPLVGDNVEIEVLDESEKKGNIVKILPRQNELIRPAVANIDQALVVFAITKPNPHFNLLDRFLVMMESKMEQLDEICSASGATDVLEADDRVWKLRRNCLESTRVLSLVSTSDDLVVPVCRLATATN